VAVLVDLARTSPDKAVRTEAVRALSRTSHPQAVAYLAEILK
jgi:HEAT repeat protein